jgi:integrase
MVGSIRQRSANSWELRVYCGVDPDTRRPRYATRTVHGAKRTARETLTALVEEVDHARTHAGSVSELLDRWFDAASPMWAASTRRQTRSVIDRHVRPSLGAIPLARLTTAMIDEFYANLRRSSGGREMSPGTVRRIHVVVHRALAQAQRWGWIYTNPASLAQPPRSEPAEIRPPAQAQVGTLLEFVRTRDLDFHLYLHLAACTGARRSQLLALRWRDVDLDTGALSFQRALVDAAGGPILQPTKNRRSNRVALDDHSTSLLVAHRHRCADGNPEAFVFSSDGHGPWRPNWVTKQFIRYRRDANVGTFRLHDLRHFMATTMLAHGVPVVTVSERLGHARASTTLNVYAHSIPGADQEAAKLVARLIHRGYDAGVTA